MISKFSVKKPYTVLVGVVLAIVLGVVSFTKMTADLLPDINLPYVIVMTTYPGASPETVETAVTQPVEAAMATVSNIENISSVSNENYSIVILEFAQSANMDSVSLDIRENLDQIKSYWDDSIGNPIIMKLNPNMLPVMIAAVGVEGMDVADISTYVKDTVAPELESVEGVASASAVGLLEESVNVVIRKDKIDAVNQQIYASIDEKMADAEKELAEGRQTLEDSSKELAEGRQQIADGKKELEDGEKQLADGKQQLKDKQAETAASLAATKTQLLTAKTDLEASKMTLTTNLSTAKSLNDGIKEIDEVLNLGASYTAATTQYSEAAATGDTASMEAAVETIKALKKGFKNNSIVSQMSKAAPEIETMITTLKDTDWTDPGNMPTVAYMLNMLSTSAEGTMGEQRANLADALNSLTNGLGYSEYKKTVDSAVKKIDENLAQVNAGLVEIEKGELTAAIEFANASAEISLSEYQLGVAKTQLETTEQSLTNGEEQLNDARTQIEDGEKQLADAKESAYESADMTNILTVDMVKNILTAQNFSMPAGYVTEDGVDYLVRVGDKPSSVEDLQELPLLDLHMDGVDIVRLGDVADVFYTDNSADIYSNVNGNAGVMLSIQKQTGYSTGDVSDALKAKFESMMEENTDLSLITLMDQGIYIDLVMDSIINNILFGAILAILILIIFLRDIRPTMVIAISIPISLVAAVVCMYFSGITLNVISLSGLALGIGMLVDNSIVVIENIYRLRGEGYSMKEAAIVGAKEVAGAIAASTLTTVCVFLPIVFTEGITRQLFVDMGLTIGYSLLASLVIALTVVPAMSSKVLTKSKNQKDGKIFGALMNIYEKLLKGSLFLKPVVLILVLVLLVVSVIAASSNGTAFMADMDSTQLSVTVTLDDEATLAETAEITDQVVEAIMSIEDIEDVGAMTSASTMSLLSGSSGGGATNSSSIYVVASEDKKLTNEEIASIILEKTADLDADIRIDTSSMDLSAMGGSGITIQIRGREIDTLQELATQVADIIGTVEGTVDVNNGLTETDEEMRIIVDKDKAVGYGLTVAQVFSQVYSKIADASSATTLTESAKDYSVYVMSGEDIELTRELLKEIELDGTGEDNEKVKVPLSEIAAFETAQTMTSINRVDQSRYIAVTAGIADGYNVGLVATDVEKALENFEIPAGYSLVYSGENETINNAMEQMVLMLALAIVFMYLIMVAQFQSLLSPFIIMFTIPLAFTGGFLGLYFTGSEISVIAMIGFVMLSGIIVNNGIVLIDYANQLRENGMERREAILTAGRTRLRPVLMTALTTILALSTMVFSSDMGAEMSKPMAIVTIGGLIYGTLLTLIVIPCIYDSFMKWVDKRRAKRETKRAISEGILVADSTSAQEDTFDEFLGDDSDIQE